MAQAQDVVDLVRDVLGDDVVGGYLHGSAVLGGLRPSSDVDVLVVAHRPTLEGERRALVDGLLEVSGSRARRGPGRPVELTVVVQADVRPWRFPPLREFQYGEWLRDDYERGLTPSPTPDADLALLITMVLQGDRAVFGPPAAEVLDPVPTNHLRAALVGGVPGLLAELETDTRNVVLTLARIWMTLDTTAIASKDDAAQWVLARLPAEHRAVLARARAGYLGHGQERWDDLAPRLRPHADHVVAQIERLSSG